jgi:hypothetical protein
VLLAAPANASPKSDPSAVARRLAQTAATDDWSYRFLEGLTTEVGERLAGTPAMERAALWAQAQLKRAGFDKVTAESFPMTGWVRGAESAQVVAPAPQSLIVTALGNSVATPADGITAEIALFRTYAELIAAPAGSLKDKIAVVTQRMVRAEDGSGYGVMSGSVRGRGASEAARRGAAAYLCRSVGTDNHRIAHTGAMRYADDAPRIPAAALSNPDADQLERLAARGAVKIHLLLTPTSSPDAQSWNIVAEVKGRERPDEIVLIGAHLDSWDLGTGATDDGAGVAIVAGAGRLIAALPRHPKRTVRVILFGAEERGFSGAAYAAAHKTEAARMVVASESDFGARTVYALRLPEGTEKSPFALALTSALTPLGINLSADPARFGGSDFDELQDLGVPVISLRQRGADYFDIHHTADDTFDKVDPQELAQNVAVWADFAYLAAETDIDLRKAAPPAPASK